LAPSIRPRSRNRQAAGRDRRSGVFSAGRARRTAGSPPPQGLGRGLFQGHLRQAARLSDAVPGLFARRGRWVPARFRARQRPHPVRPR
jgi:hypothetical protein